MAEFTTVNDTTFFIDNLGDIKPKIKIGGDDAAKFIPNVNMSFEFNSEDEFYFNLNRKDKVVTNEVVSFSDGTISQTIDGETDEYYLADDNRLKWDIIFYAIPDKKKIEFEIDCSEKVDFIYQGELDADEISDSCYRPAGVIGSYTVYCDKKNNVYKTGKLVHIYRPIFIDADNNTIFGELEINDNKLTILLPEDFMATAVYPVRLDPTFGYLSIGASTHYQYTSDDPMGTTYNTHTAVTGDTVTQFHFYGGMITAASILNIAAYSVSGGILASRLGAATEIPATSATPQWWSSSAVSIGMSNGVEYGLAFECYGEASNGCFVAYDLAGSGQRHDTGESLPATWSSAGTNSRTYSLYATYTEAGAGATIPVILNQLRNQGVL